MGKRKYTEEQEAALVARLGASAMLTRDKPVPQYTAVSKDTGVPIGTLENMWNRAGEETRAKVSEHLMRARGEAAEEIGREWFDVAMRQMAGNLQYITSAERFKPVIGEDPKTGREYVIVPGLRADQAARAYRDAHDIAFKLASHFGLNVGDGGGGSGDDPPDLATAEGREQMVKALSALPPEVVAEALRRIKGDG